MKSALDKNVTMDWAIEELNIVTGDPVKSKELAETVLKQIDTALGDLK